MKYAQLTFQPMSRPTNVTPRRRSTVTTSPSRIAGVLGQVVARLAGDGHVERAEMSCQGRGVRVQVDGSFVLPRRSAEPATDVDLGDRTPGGAQALDGLDGADERGLEPGSPSASQPDPAWKWTVSIVRSCRRAAARASSSRSRPIPNLVGRSPEYSRWSL